jgi:hypothetical protein
VRSQIGFDLSASWTLLQRFLLSGFLFLRRKTGEEVFDIISLARRLRVLERDAVDGSSQTEVANLDRAILVDEHVGRLEVSVEDACRMDVL